MWKSLLILIVASSACFADADISQPQTVSPDDFTVSGFDTAEPQSLFMAFQVPYSTTTVKSVVIERLATNAVNIQYAAPGAMKADPAKLVVNVSALLDTNSALIKIAATDPLAVFLTTITTGSGTLAINKASGVQLPDMAIIQQATQKRSLRGDANFTAVPGYVDNVYLTRIVAAKMSQILTLSPPLPEKSVSVNAISSDKIATKTVSDADWIKTVGNTVGYDAAMKMMQARGVTFIDPVAARPLPSFYSAVTVMNGLELKASEVATYAQLKSQVKMIRLIGVTDAALADLTTYLTANPDGKFVFIVDDEIYRPEIAKLLSLTKPVAVIVGHYINADHKPDTFADWADGVRQHRELVRRLCDAPIILACSYVPYYRTDPPNAGWANAFGADELAKFDGFAVYNIHNFALMEMTTRTEICKALGLPVNKPTLVLDFLGTRGMSDDNRIAWTNKKVRFYNNLLSQGWRGIMYLSIDGLADAQVKDDVISSMPINFRFNP